MATVNYLWNLPTVGGDEDAWGGQLNANWTALDTLLGGVSQTEFAILNGATVTTAELNILDGVTATTAELNLLDGVTAKTGLDTSLVTGTAGASGQIAQWNADGDIIGVDASISSGYIFGLTLSNNAVDASNDIDIAAGSAASDASTPVFITLSAPITKRLDAAWVVGTNNGGLDTGSKANSTWYHVWLIRRSDTGVVDALFSTSATSPTLPADYDQKRRIGAVRTDGSGNILAFYQNGDDFLWNASILDVNGSSGGTAAVLATLSVPSGVRVRAHIQAFHQPGSGTRLIHFSSPDVADQAPSTTAAPLATVGNDTTTGNVGPAFVWTNTSSQVRYRVATSGTVRIATLGWTDNRGRLA